MTFRMRQYICIIGATGKVGRELVWQIATHDVPELNIHENPTLVMALVDSTHTAICTGGFSKEMLEQFVASRLRVADLPGAKENESDDEVGVDAMKRMGYGEDLVYVDVTGEKNADRLHLDIMRRTRSKIVTANKNPVGLSSYATYRELTRDPTRYKYSATTMAGLGAVPWLSERHTIGDRVHRIDASLSGTLGFIADEISKGKKLSDAIEEARKSGYTEPDFRDDLNGVDVARKMTILAREAGYPVEFGDIAIEPFLPKEYFLMVDPEECLAQIRSKLDGNPDFCIDQKRSRRYLASLDLPDGATMPHLRVGPKFVSLTSPFAHLQGTDNFIEVVTNMYTDQKPYRLQGPGAGLEITASVVRRDLLNCQNSISRS